MNLVQKFMLRKFSKEFLSRFRWYREHIGGYWVHSNVMGWNTTHKENFLRDIRLSMNHPYLYDNGRELEWYEPTNFEITTKET